MAQNRSPRKDCRRSNPSTGWFWRSCSWVGWLKFEMLHHPAWAVGNYRSCPPLGGALKSKSTQPCYQSDLSPCIYLTIEIAINERRGLCRRRREETTHEWRWRTTCYYWFMIYGYFLRNQPTRYMNMNTMLLTVAGIAVPWIDMKINIYLVKGPFTYDVHSFIAIFLPHT